jgi:hypothetical protein
MRVAIGDASRVSGVILLWARCPRPYPHQVATAQSEGGSWEGAGFAWFQRCKRVPRCLGSVGVAAVPAGPCPMLHSARFFNALIAHKGLPHAPCKNARPEEVRCH